MRLIKVEIKNFRSIFPDETDKPLTLDLGDGMNTIVGPNNCGKSNVFRALAVALDAEYTFDRLKDMPSVYTWAKPSVTLTFDVREAGRPQTEKTLLKYLDEYEKATNPKVKRTYASQGIIKLRVTIEGGDDSASTRREAFVVAAAGARSLPDDDPVAIRTLKQFHKCLHFVLIHSGQDLESLMEGKFRDILNAVLKADAAAEYRAADESRERYLKDLRAGLLQPLAERISVELNAAFPDVMEATLKPDIRSLDEHLTSMRVQVSDSAITDLSEKGTGVRGGLIVAMLRYLADTGRRSMLFAVEEPEAFLHPGAQEALRENLEALAQRRDVSLLVATHSPYVVSRADGARVFSLAKDEEGRTVIDDSADGSDPQAAVLGGLFRDRMVADLLDRSSRVDADSSAVLIVEGATDVAFMRVAADKVGRPELVDDLSIISAGTGVLDNSSSGATPGGASLAVMQSLLVHTFTDKPVGVVLDNDEPGQQAEQMLAQIGTKTGEWKRGRNLLNYHLAFDPNLKNFPIEAEDLWSQRVLKAFAEEVGEEIAVKNKMARPNPLGGFQYDFHGHKKKDLVEYLRANAQPEDCTTWIEFIEFIRTRLGIPVPEPKADPREDPSASRMDTPASETEPAGSGTDPDASGDGATGSIGGSPV